MKSKVMVIGAVTSEISISSFLNDDFDLTELKFSKM